MKRILLILATFMVAAAASAQLNTDRLMSVGRNALYFHDYVLSIQYFNSIIRVKPNLSEPYFYRAVAKIELEDYVGARRDLDSVIRRNPFMPAAYYARSYVAGHDERWADAEQDIRQALHFSPDNVTYLINLVNIYEATERPDSALTVLDRMIRRSPAWPELRLERLGLLIETGDTLQALDEATLMIRKEPREERFISARAAINLLLDRPDSALNDCNLAIRLGTANPGVYINRAIILGRRNRFNDALADYDRALELDPANINALFNRGLMRHQLGDNNRSLDDLDRLIALNPELDEAIYVRAEVLARLGQTQRAITDYTTVIDRHQTFVPAYYARADLYDRLRQAKPAYLDREKAQRLMDDHKHGRLSATDTLNTDARVSRDQSIVESVATLFVTAQDDGATEQGVRGLVQNQRIDLSPEPNFVVSYYRESCDNIIYKEYDPIELQEFVSRYLPEKHLYLVTHEVPISSSLTDYYFSEIEGLSRMIIAHPANGILYLVRAIDYAQLSDFQNALDDLTRAILNGVDQGIVYLMRSEVRYKQSEAAIANSADADQSLILRQQARERELTLRDLDRAADLMPRAGFVLYNKANLLAEKGEYKRAHAVYTAALGLEPEMAEAYFNRGLVLMRLNRIDEAVDDMSRAGELGLYRAYRIIKELKTRK